MTKKRPIRILRIIARLNIGGPAINAINLSVSLDKKEFVTLLACGKVGSNEGDMSYLASEKGLVPIIIPELGREISILDDLKSFAKLRKIIKEYDPDIIHTHTAKAGTLGRLAGISCNFFRGKKKRIKLVHTFHGHIFHSYFGFFKTLFFIHTERFLAKFTNRIIVISSLQKRDICQTYRISGPDNVQEVQLGFDLTKFQISREDEGYFRDSYFSGIDGSTKIIAIIGRLTHVKNHRLFLKAVRYLKNSDEIDRFRFLIIGGGELKEDLIQYSKELSVEGVVKFLDWQKGMSSVYGSIDVVTLTSHNEGTPVTLIEAMAAGIPVVATDVGGVRDLLGSTEEKMKYFLIAKNGILIPPEDGSSLARALIFLDENNSVVNRITSNAKDFVLNNFSIERLVKEMESLYCGLVEERNSLF